MIRPCLAIQIADGAPSVAVPLRLATGSEAIAARIAIRLWTIRGSWPDDTLLGLPHIRWSGPSVPAVEVEAETRRQVGAVDGVVDVLAVTAQWIGTSRSLSVRALVSTEPGVTLELVVGGDADGYQPGAWYYVVRPIVPDGS